MREKGERVREESKRGRAKEETESKTLNVNGRNINAPREVNWERGVPSNSLIMAKT